MMSETKYCTDCGSQMDKTEEICPECGVKQPVTKTKYCVDCGSKIDAKTDICPDCGVRQPGATNYQQPRNDLYKQPVILKNPGIAAVLSAFFVGIGQIYNGQIAKGLLFMVAYFVSILLIFVLIGFITTPLLWIFGIYDAYNTANRINSGEIVV